LWLLLGLVTCFYSIRVTEITIRGEESRRGRIAWEMWQTGDWIVPRLQGEPVFYRPPLQNWMIAVAGAARGEIDAWAVRLPSVIAILLTLVIIYGYTRSFLSPFGAFSSALCYASLGQVLELGRLGETDAIFTLFLSGSLLSWKWCRNCGVSPWRTWCTGYALAALATLTKGPQAPLYFVGSVAVFCVVTRRWRDLFTPAHIAGITVALAIVGLWQVPYTMQMGLDRSVKIYFQDVGPRFSELSRSTLAWHLLTYPLQLLGGSLLPWSVWLLCVLDRNLRRGIGRWRDEIWYLAICLAVTFPSVWFAPGASLRYYMPLFPCLACVVGIIMEGFVTFSPAAGWSAFIWGYYRLMAGLMASAGAGLLIVSLVRPNLTLAQSTAFALIYCGFCVLTAGAIWRSSGVLTRKRLLICSVALACFLGLTESSLLVNVRCRTSENAARKIASLKRQIPDSCNLVSIGPAHHLFLFHLKSPLKIVGKGNGDPNAVLNDGYFCVWLHGKELPQVNFPWEPIATICCDRSRSRNPVDTMVVGRVKSNAIVAHASHSPR
jgi:4-amino-4-deoxy-L-arabinose transferase-like glycosyltransferase